MEAFWPWSVSRSFAWQAICLFHNTSTCPGALALDNERPDCARLKQCARAQGVRKDDGWPKITVIGRPGQNSVLKTSSVATNSFFTLPKERVRSDLKHLENWLRMSWERSEAWPFVGCPKAVVMAQNVERFYAWRCHVYVSQSPYIEL